MIKKLILLIFFIVFFILPSVFFIWWQQVSSPVNKEEQDSRIVVIPQGWGVKQIGEYLKNENLIKDVFAFRIIVIKEGISQNLQAGDFRLSKAMNLFEISQALTHGTLDIWVTLPEGLRNEEVTKVIEDSFNKYSADFDTDGFLKLTAEFEGYLFPDTYLIPKDSNSEDIINILKDNFNKKYTLILVQSNFNKKQIVTLASLVEREVRQNKDRAIVAGILIKRLKKGWPLQVDATIQYALANNKCKASELECDWWPTVASQDLKIASSYNTYENQDLPPTPICNPGLESLKAVANPQDSEYWFYLSDLQGEIHYAKNLEEHEENIKKYLD